MEDQFARFSVRPIGTHADHADAHEVAIYSDMQA